MREKTIGLRSESDHNKSTPSQAEQMPSFAVPENQPNDWSKIPDYFRGLKVDLKTAGDNPKFIEYLKDIHGESLDVTRTEDAPKLREAYVRFQRAEKITQQYTDMFGDRFGNLLENSTIESGKKQKNPLKDKRISRHAPLSYDGKNNSRLFPNEQKDNEQPDVEKNGFSVGDEVMWENSGVLQWKNPRTIVAIEEAPDSEEKFAKFDDAEGKGYAPLKELLSSEKPTKEQKPASQETSKEEEEIKDVDYKTAIEKYIREIAKNHPEKLRSLEKKFERAEKSEQQIKAKQKIIDNYRTQGGKEGLTDKLDTLTKANSWKRILFSKPVIRLLGYGQQEILAYEKSQKEFDLTDRQKIKQEIIALKNNIKTIGQAEKAKDKIKSKYKSLRTNIYFENDLAKKVFAKSQALLDKKISSLANLDSLTELKEGKKFLEQLKTAFDNENISRGKRQETFEKIPVTSSAEEFSDMEEYLDKALEEKLEQSLSKALIKTELTKIDGEVKNLLKKTEFAGKSSKESIKLVYETFVKLKNNTKLDIEKKLQLGFSLNKYKYLTA